MPFDPWGIYHAGPDEAQNAIDYQQVIAQQYANSVQQLAESTGQPVITESQAAENPVLAAHGVQIVMDLTTTQEYSFDNSPGVATALGIIDNTNPVPGAAPQPSSGSFFGSLADVIKSVGQAVATVKAVPAPNLRIPGQTVGVGPGGAMVTTATQSTQTWLVGGAVILAILLVIALFK